MSLTKCGDQAWIQKLIQLAEPQLYILSTSMSSKHLRWLSVQKKNKEHGIDELMNPSLQIILGLN